MEVEMGGACNTHERDENAHKNLRRKFWRQETTCETRRKWDNIKMDLK
jgi:hypothetical protein